MRLFARIGMCVALCMATASAFAQKPENEGLKVACGSVGIELRLCTEAVRKWSEENHYPATVVSMPALSSERLALYQQFFSAKQSSIDVFQIDVVWPGILKTHLLDLAPLIPKEEVDRHFETIMANNWVDGKLLAMPLYTDVGVLFYRKDMLEKYGEEVPETWDQLEASARRIQAGERAAGNRDIWGYVWQGKAYEGLTCNALEWLASSGAGSIVERDGTISADKQKALNVIKRAASWIGTISPSGVLNYSEEEARGVFQSGKAVFMRNWPYAWSLAQGEGSPVKDKIGVTTIPRGGFSDSHAGALGGWQMAVSKYSTQQEKAVELVRYLSGPEVQYQYAVLASYNPTIKDLYKKQEVMDALPAGEVLYRALFTAASRPSQAVGLRYNRVSNDFWNAVHAVLSKEMTAEEAFSDLDKRWSRFRSEDGTWH